MWLIRWWPAQWKEKRNRKQQSQRVTALQKTVMESCFWKRVNWPDNRRKWKREAKCIGKVLETFQNRRAKTSAWLCVFAGVCIFGGPVRCGHKNPGIPGITSGQYSISHLFQGANRSSVVLHSIASASPLKHTEFCLSPWGFASRIPPQCTQRAAKNYWYTGANFYKGEVELE